MTPTGLGRRGGRVAGLLLACVASLAAACSNVPNPTPGSATAPLATVPPSATVSVVSAAPSADATLGPPSQAPTSGPTAPPTASPPPLTPPPVTPAPTPAGLGYDPCSLLSKGELELTTGHPLVETTQVVRSGSPSGCRWLFDSGTPGITWELDLGITTPGGRAAFAEAKPFAADGTPIPSLGEDSYPVIGNTIFALRGDLMVDVQYVNTGSDANRLTVPESVIRLALDRIPQ